MKPTIREDWWRDEFVPSKGPVDYISRDEKTVVEVQAATSGRRGLHAAVMQLAVFLEHQPKVERACLVLRNTRMSQQGVRDEWHASKRVLRTSIAKRLALIVVENTETWIDPDDSDVARIAKAFAPISENGDGLQSEALAQSPGQKVYEVHKVLLNRWLQRQGPIALKELAKVVGCSYPTVKKALEKPSLRAHLRFASNRSVELEAFPHDSWSEIVALSRSFRKSFRFRDRSGDKPAPQLLLRRLVKNNPLHLALGGVLSARRWHPDFDLHGTPRLDLTCHSPDGSVNLSFVHRIDPGLVQVDSPLEPAVLVVHPLVREKSLFDECTAGDFPWADAVETALDLCDLSLTGHANRLLTHLRPEVRLE